MNDGPTLQQIFEAKRLLRRYMASTPLHHYPGLSKLLDAQVYVKHENHTATGAFKIRGGLNVVARLTDEERKRGIIVASSGNFGQAVAYAGRIFGAKVVVGLPEDPNPSKVEAIEGWGGEVVLTDTVYDPEPEYINTLARERGYRIISDIGDMDFIAGSGTCMLEILEQLPEVEVVILPVGGGGFASGVCIAGKGIKPEVEIIGVCAEAAPSPYLSWKEGRLVEAPMGTFAEGIGVRVSFDTPLRIMRQLLDDFVVVGEEEIRRAMVLMLEKTHNVAEGAGATPLAAALKLKGKIKGRKTVLIQSGGNAALEELRAALATVDSEIR